MNIKSRSALSFNELKNKSEEIYEFGNDWGLYIDIEINYHNHFRDQKLNKSKYPIHIINEIDETNEDNSGNLNTYDNNYTYLNKNNSILYRVKLFLHKCIFYLLISLRLSFMFDNKKL